MKDYLLGLATLPLAAVALGALWFGGAALTGWIRRAFKWHNLSRHDIEKRARMAAHWSASWAAGHRVFMFKPMGVLIFAFGFGRINDDLYLHLEPRFQQAINEWNADVDPESGKRRATVNRRDTTEETDHG